MKIAKWLSEIEQNKTENKEKTENRIEENNKWGKR